MALDAGELTFVLEYATNLKDHDWFGKQDPYCIVTCGTQTYRSRTATDGGRNPVWNQTFRFNVINDNDVSIMVKDEDIGPDDYIGTARLSLARARMYGSDRQQVPVINRRGKQHGYVHVVLNFTRSTAYMAPHAYGHTAPYPAQPAAFHPPPPYYGAPPPAAYTAPPYGAPPAAAYPPPAAYPPSPYSAPPPASPYHPYAPAPAPYPAYGAAPAPAAYPPAPMGYPPVRVGYY